MKQHFENILQETFTTDVLSELKEKEVDILNPYNAMVEYFDNHQKLIKLYSSTYKEAITSFQNVSDVMHKI